jgi:hypothetical protein
MSNTLFDKFARGANEDGPDVFLLSHFIHEVTSPVAFRFKRGISVLYQSATADHNTQP